jgi:hypothetical protein
MSSKAYEHAMKVLDEYQAAWDAIAGLPPDSLTTIDLIRLLDLVQRDRQLMQRFKRMKVRLVYGAPPRVQR